jgi:hypothetical protein
MHGSGWVWNSQCFPKLTAQNNTKTSERKRRYNCIAWAAGTKTQWWWPDTAAIATKDAYWPPGIPVTETIDAFLMAFGTKRYVECADPNLEARFEKIAIYAIVHPNGRLEPTHAGRQLRDGSWTSKIGQNVDICHTTLDAVGGPCYGTAVRYMKRAVRRRRSATR